MGTGFVPQLADWVETIKRDATLHVVVVEGGSRYFSAGASRGYLIQTQEDTGHPGKSFPAEHILELPPLLLSIPVPTVAAMAGHGIGGGFILGLWCDIPVLAEQSLYGMNFMALGFTPGPGAIVALEETVGVPLARELILTGRLVKGHELKANGGPLAHAIVPKDQVRTRALEIATDLESVPRASLLLLKGVLSTRRREDFQQVLPHEIAMQRTLFSSTEIRRVIAERYVTLSASEGSGS